jgi:nucleoside diphosphate kinase
MGSRAINAVLHYVLELDRENGGQSAQTVMAGFSTGRAQQPSVRGDYEYELSVNCIHSSPVLRNSCSPMVLPCLYTSLTLDCNRTSVQRRP